MMPEWIVGPEKPVYCRLCGRQHRFLSCSDCNKFLRMGNYRFVYCPKCKASKCDPRIDLFSDLCCAECKKPLRVTVGEGSYCAHCDYHPMMQDTIFVKFPKSKTRR